MSLANMDFRTVLEVLIVLWNCGLTLVVWMRKPGEDAGAAVDALREDVDQRLNEQSAAITEIRAHMEHMPTSEELKELEGAVKQIDERTRGMADSMTTVRSALSRIEDYLLRQAR